jgi:hypothetical protein
VNAVEMGDADDERDDAKGRQRYLRFHVAYVKYTRPSGACIRQIRASMFPQNHGRE